MTERSIECTFHHVTSDVVDLIVSSFGIRAKHNKNQRELSCTCTLSKANLIRSTFANTLSKYPESWFSIAIPKNIGNAFIPFKQNIGNDIHVSFGSLLSTSTFIVHDIPLNERNQWTITLLDAETLRIECQADPASTSSLYVTLSMGCVQKPVLVIDGNTYSDIILNMNVITTDVRAVDNTNYHRLYGNNPIIQSLSRCSDILIRFSSKSDADKFLDFLRIKHECQIFYTMISIERSQCKPWDKIEFNWYPSNDAAYAMCMLCSLGYLFEDKYLMNEKLQSTMVDLSEKDEKRFYQLAVDAFHKLKICHWLDLTTIFNQKQFDQIQIKVIQNDNQSFHVGVVHLTPTHLCILPKTETKGHRIMRHELFQGENNFCLVDLKPDPSEKYLTNDQNALAYFQEVFETGIELGTTRYHLFGSSSSQLRDHSFWFTKASTLDEIEQKRSYLGELDRIDNLGTYAARLGLWFSSTSPTSIKLSYCQTIQEFNKRVQQREPCVMDIGDIWHGDYCFTDGNGFISKGLAKRVAEKLSTGSTRLKRGIFPSAYQIRMAGCKGLLIIDPQSNLDQFYIKIRPSMEKFKCNDWTLDICDHSRPTATRLNGQIIVLLSDLGVPDETFLRLQKQWFDKKPSISYADPLLKNKIPLPAKECRYMYGCAFESKLKPGTCFIRYEVLNENGRPLSNPQFECVRGRVIVTKNPCPYAGDMIELTAVDIPELHCLSDVIVFSTEGDRPDFNKIAGSDLDGDGYFVYWGEEFRLQRTVPPLAYKADDKTKHPTRITPKDVISYYLSTLGATSYGEIYNLHAVIVDRNDENHPQRTCQQLAIELARMFASAIDSGKTGYVPDKERVQEIRKQYGQQYPDFLMKFGKSYYPSKSILGVLYRNALAYKKGDIVKLNDAFAKLRLDDDRLQASSPIPLNSLPVNTPTELTNSEKNKANNRPKSTRKSMQ